MAGSAGLVNATPAVRHRAAFGRAAPPPSPPTIDTVLGESSSTTEYDESVTSRPGCRPAPSALRVTYHEYLATAAIKNTLFAKSSGVFGS
jgi:hypothetical protein